MSVTSHLSKIVAYVVVTTVAIFIAAKYSSFYGGLTAAAIFAGCIIATAMRVNQPYWRLEHDGIDLPQIMIDASRNNAHLMAITFTWGALVMISVYLLTGLYWFHAWQYALAMVLIAGALFGYAYLITKEGHVLQTKTSLDISAMLSTLQGLGTTGGIVFLIGSGKLQAYKSDWVANLIFLCGGTAIIALSAIAVVTHLKLSKTTGPTHEGNS